MKMGKSKKKIVNQAAKIKKHLSGEERTLSIGAYARMKRLQKRMTQSEASKGICSLSYVSKVEANKIKLNEKIQHLLFERLDVKHLEVVLLENVEEEMRELAENNFYLDLTYISNKYSEIVDIDGNIVASLYKLNYYLLFNMPKLAEKIIEELSDLVGSMSVITISMYAYLASETYILVGLYEDAFEIIQAMLKIDCIPEKLRILLLGTLFKCTMNMGRFAMSLYYYQDLSRHYLEYNCIRRLNEIKMNYFEILFASKEYDMIISSDEIKRNVPGDFLFDEYYYILAMSAYKLGRFVFAKESFNRISKKSKYYSMALPVIYEISNEEEKEELIRFVKDRLMIEEDFYLRYFIDLIEDILTINTFRNPYHDLVLKEANIFERRLVLMAEYNYLKKKCKYKEANLILERMASF